MEEIQRRCPKCDGPMEQGFLPDSSYGDWLVSCWYKGPPKKSFWTRTKGHISEGIPIGAFRCSICGFLELYALDDFAAS
jgi:hypothetical protein